MYQSYWSGPNDFELVQIIKLSPEKSNLNCEHDRNDMDPTKTIWT